MKFSIRSCAISVIRSCVRRRPYVISRNLQPMPPPKLVHCPARVSLPRLKKQKTTSARSNPLLRSCHRRRPPPYSSLCSRPRHPSQRAVAPASALLLTDPPPPAASSPVCAATLLPSARAPALLLIEPPQPLASSPFPCRSPQMEEFVDIVGSSSTSSHGQLRGLQPLQYCQSSPSASTKGQFSLVEQLG